MNYPEVDVYNRAPKDFKFHQKNFFINYINLIDRKMFKENRENYINILKATQKAVKNVDYEKDVLFICNERVHKEVFLCGMLTFEDLMSYYYCNILKIADIWNGYTRTNNPNSIDGEVRFSEQEIRERILCMYCDCEMTWSKYDCFDSVARNLIVSRSVGNRSDGKKQYNWTFFRGVLSQMKGDDRGGYDNVLEYYKSEGEIVDLNQNNEYMQYIRKILKRCNTAVHREDKNIEHNLSDIY